MAFINASGESISYECGDWIEMLKDDIAECGNDLKVEVITARVQGVTIYKDYGFIGQNELRPLKSGEELHFIDAIELLKLYIQENSII